MMRRPGSLRLLGLIASVLTAGALVAAPALAAGEVHVSLSYNTATLQMPKTDLTTNGTPTKTYSGENSGKPIPQLNPCRQGGGTFADTSVNGTGFPAGKAYTPTGSPVSFQMPSSATGKNAVCLGLGGSAGTGMAPVVTGMDSTTINVPKGNYTDAYFLAATGNGPALVYVTPVYGSTKGSVINVDVPDWCAGPTGAKLPSTATAGWNGGVRVGYTGSLDSNTKLTCGFYTVHVPGLDSSKQLTALDLQLAPAKTPVTIDPNSGKTQNGGLVTDIMALTLQGTALPGTGGSPLLPVAGVLALGLGAVLLYRPRFSRSNR